MTRLTNKQAARFEAKLHTIAEQSAKVNNTLLRELATKRDAYLANLRKWLTLNAVQSSHKLDN